MRYSIERAVSMKLIVTDIMNFRMCELLLLHFNFTLDVYLFFVNGKKYFKKVFEIKGEWVKISNVVEK